MHSLTADQARQHFMVDEETGQLIRTKTVASNAVIGSVAGSLDKLGYLRVHVLGKKYSVHRIVWLVVRGEFPNGDIDHINGVKTDNRICNLREVSKMENQRNKALGKNNRSGFIGVSFSKRDNMWNAQIVIRKKAIHIGTFKTPDEANTARLEFSKKFNFHENHGRNSNA